MPFGLTDEQIKDIVIIAFTTAVVSFVTVMIIQIVSIKVKES